MGYYASGEGKAKLKQNVNIENLVADIERIYGEGSIEWEIQNDTIIIFSDDNSHSIEFINYGHESPFLIHENKVSIRQNYLM